MAGSAPKRLKAGPNTLLTKAVRYGAAAMMPATGRNMGPIESMPATNSCPSSLSGFITEAMQPAMAHAMMMYTTICPNNSMR